MVAVQAVLTGLIFVLAIRRGEGGVAPGELVVTDSTPGHNARSMPMCVYPKWPRYNGTGDVNAASSFTCVAS